MLLGSDDLLLVICRTSIYVYMSIVVLQTSCVIYVLFKGYIVKSIGLNKSTPDNKITDTESKLCMGLGSHKQLVLTSQ